MTIYISPNPGKTSANEIALRAAQILLTHGAAVLMCKELCAECSTAGVVYLPQEECLERSDVILTIGGDGTILHEQTCRSGMQSRSLASIWDAAVFWQLVRSTKWRPNSPLLPEESSVWITGCCCMCMFWAMMAGRDMH